MITRIHCILWGLLPSSRYWHDDVIKWKHFLRYWPFVRGIHRLPVNSPHKGQWRGALMFSLICAWTNGWAKHRDLRCHRAHYDVTVMLCGLLLPSSDYWEHTTSCLTNFPVNTSEYGWRTFRTSFCQIGPCNEPRMCTVTASLLCVINESKTVLPETLTKSINFMNNSQHTLMGSWKFA